ncbi:MAG: nucleoside recognition protein [Candidatus Fonsibacter ubiquis]|nr:nucleoside recognition protein [Candidatus Fonsibacter ubiquis]
MNTFFKNSFLDIKDICLPLYKILIPFIFIIKILEEIGIVKVISNFFEPIVQLMGLPAEFGIIWVTAIIVNVYAAIILFINIVPTLDLTVAQVTVLTLIILIAHNILIESAISRAANILKKIGVEQFIKKILENPLKLMGIGSGAINIIIVGLTIGLQFGGGLLIKEAKSGAIDKQSILLSLSLLNLIHAIIEDTILMMIIGGHISGVLFFRIIFCLIIVFLILYLYKKFSGLFKFVFVKI